MERFLEASLQDKKKNPQQQKCTKMHEKYLHRKVGDGSQLFLVMIQRCQIFHLRCRMDPLRVATLQVSLISLSLLDFMAFPLKHLTAPSWCLPEGLSTTTLNFVSMSPHQGRAQHLPHGGCRAPELLDPGPPNHSHPCSCCWRRDLSHEHEEPMLLLEPGSPVLQQWGSCHCLVPPTSWNIYQGFFVPRAGCWCSFLGSYFLAVPLG